MSLIPEGPYCYGSNGRCLFWGHRNFHGIKIPFCAFLNKGDVGKLSDKDFDNLKVVYHCTDEELYDLFNASELWDQCKCCGINEGSS